MIGETLGSYRIIQKIGAGGMADVYLAEQASVGRQVAIKVLPPEALRDPTFRKRFEREARIVAGLTHAAILAIHDFGFEGQMPYIVMPYLSGGNLADLISQYPAGMPLDLVTRLVDRIADGLDYAHSRGVIHRDFKPSNVLFDDAGNPYIADFGIAKAAAETVSLTGTGRMIGTPHYMAPELAEPGDPGPGVDLYALGVTLYQMLAGRVPYDAATPMGVLMAHASKAVPDIRDAREDVNEAVRRVVSRTMAKQPTDRYPSAREMAVALAAAAASDMSVVQPETDWESNATRDVPLPPPPEPVKTPTDAPTTDMETPPPMPRRTRQQRGWLLPVGGGVIMVGLVLGVIAALGAFGNGGEPAAMAEATEVVELVATDAPTQTTEPTVTTPPTPTKTIVAPTATNQPTPTQTTIPTAINSPTPTHTAVTTTTVTTQPMPTQTNVPTATATFSPSESARILAETGVSSNDEWTPYIEVINGVEMVLVPAGCFMMGSNELVDEQPIHEVCFEYPYWLDLTEVTNTQFGSTGYFVDVDRPRDRVNWFESLAHCESRGARLPTEAEWEYAARGPNALVYPWGNEFVKENANTYLYYTYTIGSTAPVGFVSNGASWVGALDMIGNVSEWTSSLYEPYPYDPNDGREIGTENSNDRVLRGGGWSVHSSNNLRSADRVSVDPRYDWSDYGFRCALSYIDQD